jgi:hypothetical protein
MWPWQGTPDKDGRALRAGPCCKVACSMAALHRRALEVAWSDATGPRQRCAYTTGPAREDGVSRQGWVHHIHLRLQQVLICVLRRRGSKAVKPKARCKSRRLMVHCVTVHCVTVHGVTVHCVTVHGVTVHGVTVHGVRCMRRPLHQDGGQISTISTVPQPCALPRTTCDAMRCTTHYALSSAQRACEPMLCRLHTTTSRRGDTGKHV